MKRYYVHYYNNFNNTYSLHWAETPEQIAEAENLGYERITRKEAENLCSAENNRRKSDPSFAYFASAVILPVGYDGDWVNDRRMKKTGYIIDFK